MTDRTIDVDAELRAERSFLATARAALRGMRQEVVDTDTPLSDAEETDEIWHNTVYQLARARRAQELVDLPDVPLFFGRLDYQPGIIAEAATTDHRRERQHDPDRVYVGRRHVRDPDGNPLVVDWRAPVSRPFYRASPDDPMGVRHRRRYGFDETAALTAYEDEPLAESGAGAGGAQQAGGSALVAAEIERPRTGPMRDIVATIQPEQDELVRAPLRPTLCVQGAPGTGKTAVGLHRLAYLLYTEGERLTRDGGVVVVGPNRSFLRYIRHVLPALGEVGVSQTTIEELLGQLHQPKAKQSTQSRGSTREAATAGGADDDPAVARVKGDARMAAVLRRALWSHVRVPDEGLLYLKGSQRYRVSSNAIADIVDRLRGTTRYAAGRTAFAQRLGHLVLVQMERRGAAPDDRDQSAVARSRPVKQLLDAAWPSLTPAQVLYRLLSDADFLAASAGDDLTEAEQKTLLWAKPYRSWRSAKWTPADLVLLDELADLIERTRSLSHIMVDEAQDLSPMQCRALGRRALTGSLTVLGDIAQGTSTWAASDWPTLLHHLGAPDARLAVLDRGFRVPAQIIDFAGRLLPHIAPGLAVPTSARRASGALRIHPTTEEAYPLALTQVCREATKGGGSVGLIAADGELAELHQRLLAEGLTAGRLGDDEDALETARLVCVPASLSKGLEFDTVIVAEPARIVDSEPRGLHRLYVVLTRAVSTLHIIHARQLPTALRQTDPETFSAG